MENACSGEWKMVGDVMLKGLRTNNAKSEAHKNKSSCTKEKKSMASHTITRIGEKERGREDQIFDDGWHIQGTQHGCNNIRWWRRNEIVVCVCA